MEDGETLGVTKRNSARVKVFVRVIRKIVAAERRMRDDALLANKAQP